MLSSFPELISDEIFLFSTNTQNTLTSRVAQICISVGVVSVGGGSDGVGVSGLVLNKQMRIGARNQVKSLTRTKNTLPVLYSMWNRYPRSKKLLNNRSKVFRLTFSVRKVYNTGDKSSYPIH